MQPHFSSVRTLVLPPTPLPTTGPTPRPECLKDDECANDKACFDKKCQDPCVLRQPCGVNARCQAVDHSHRCFCLDGYVGNPWVQCVRGMINDSDERPLRNISYDTFISFSEIQVPPPTPPPPPFTPRPECRQDDECPHNRACFDHTCQDPCVVRHPCGVNTKCETERHVPVCSCLQGYVGNPLVQCLKGTSSMRS